MLLLGIGCQVPSSSSGRAVTLFPLVRVPCQCHDRGTIAVDLNRGTVKATMAGGVSVLQWLLVVEGLGMMPNRAEVTTIEKDGSQSGLNTVQSGMVFSVCVF